MKHYPEDIRKAFQKMAINKIERDRPTAQQLIDEVSD